MYVRLLAIIFLLYISYPYSSAQITSGLHPELEWRYIRTVYSNPETHTMVRNWDINKAYPDSLSQNIRYFISPLGHIELSGGNSFKQIYGVGVHTGISLKRSFFVNLNYSLTGRQFNQTDQLHIDSTNLIPHYDRYLAHKKNFYLYQSLNFNIEWNPIKYISLRIGKDRHFWGDGYRSLFLSDNANSYPFLQTTFKFWNIQYSFMTARMTDYELEEDFSKRHKKYASMHMLSWNITPSININLFEAVVWDAVDSISRRTFDINYLNPVIFLRPVEFSVGSPDNVMIGVGTKLKIWQDNYLYGQFILDEFKFDELTAGNGWWANKYAFQIGLRSFLGKKRPVMLQIELNQVRPFNYTHYYPLQNYAHLGEPLAHPMGANLREGLFIARWALNPDWSVHFINTYAVQGIDSIGSNFGSNLYKSNTTHGEAYGHKTLQGIRATTIYQELKIARTLIQKWNLQAELMLSNRHQVIKSKTKNNFYIHLGIRTLLYRD
ncbi:MAG: capsule assembly Wzi family protein [Bacteroidales bacterium]|nr:capsule assembly Wzi family protein [Bacteroidales bacterium]